ncbi:oxygen-independent coproporphyrinogen III oxidase [Thalassotalea sp. 1_MG-2023]|uniref:oxygen-independent coproporphyrinogen III oxidase n=1 Tax=Thalassotalea sp. 1_MG-2023 TaxID=3062680 RepID=UPI0026E266D8|nr:oxygen-independent coproporphyrinogen III oxidase [Thalassotalea sp. 1_MG-2023]MDO6426081.1 oxygen-independent coproporphyrinogen III oxidase [Thalassotalea sp. 1_MG-2023]
MQTELYFDPTLLGKYNTSGPRYTSYPTALEFHDQFTAIDLASAIENSKNNSLSLYVHIPFCHSLCYYCGCNKVVTRQRDKADIYLDYLVKELKAKASLFKKYHVKQLHLGGGTPSFLTKNQLSFLVYHLKKAFSFLTDIEMSIEIDPREIDLDLIDHLYELGFNRLSIGVQDVDGKVQEAINRTQSTDFIASIITRAKQLGFRSVNVDLIYGLPHQSTETFSKTIDKVYEMNVDRISLFSYAHLPSRFAAQRKLRDEWLPNAQEKFALMKLAIERLCQYGYEFIGMDHFAKPDDELAIAQRKGTLHRNFQGYTTQGNSDLLGLGVSSISAIGECYSQNEKELKQYYRAIDVQGQAITKGLTLTQDDIIRGQVIKSLMCNMHIDKAAIENQFSICFDQYFADELATLTCFINDGLLTMSSQYITVDQRARLLIRIIAMSFDAYMKQHVNQQRFSRVI